MKTFVIGDIHGADKALNQVLKRAGVGNNDKLIFLGDFVDAWSGAANVIEQLIKLSQQMECVFIKGNHDVWCEDWLETGYADRTWLAHGGKETADSYALLTDDKREQHLSFFKNMLNYYIDESNRLFIHAGFSSVHGPTHEVYDSNYKWDRTLWETALAMDPKIDKKSFFYPKRLKLFSEIYIGHTPTLYFDSYEPMRAINVWNLDTGAAFYGKLSIMDVETKQFWQSDIVQDLYPGEMGRNKS
jgi:serine/threonine protein phosphatase 1